jgi:hypothetical protein
MNTPQETETTTTEEEQTDAVAEAADLLPIGTAEVSEETESTESQDAVE